MVFNHTYFSKKSHLEFLTSNGGKLGGVGKLNQRPIKSCS